MFALLAVQASALVAIAMHRDLGDAIVSKPRAEVRCATTRVISSLKMKLPAVLVCLLMASRCRRQLYEGKHCVPLCKTPKQAGLRLEAR